MLRRKATTIQEVTEKSEETADLRDRHGISCGRIPGFQFSTWAVFVIQVWLLDFGRPFFALYFPQWFLTSDLNISDYVHMAYNILTALCLLRLQDSAPWPVPKTLQQVLLICFIMGSSIHMVADAVQLRLLQGGAKFHLALNQQPMLQNTQASVMDSFHLLDYLDESFGHRMWYGALYSLFLLYFSSCFHWKTTHKTKTTKQPSASLPLISFFSASPSFSSASFSSASFFFLLLLSTLHEWYAVTEAQVFPHFSVSSLLMLAVLLWRTQQGGTLDSNGTFLLLRSIFAHILIGVWVFVLWSDAGPRRKYEGAWLYIPEPWSYASLHLMNNSSD